MSDPLVVEAMPPLPADTADTVTDTAAADPEIGELALSPSESTFIQTHMTPVVVAMRPRLRKQSQDYRAGAPVNVTPPVVTGTGTVGQTLTTTNGTWIVNGTFTYQWLRNGVVIAGATSQTYLLVAADSGKTVSCNVTSTISGKTATVVSNGIAVA